MLLVCMSFHDIFIDRTDQGNSMRIMIQIEELEIMMTVIIMNGIECNVITPGLTTTLI